MELYERAYVQYSTVSTFFYFRCNCRKSIQKRQEIKRIKKFHNVTNRSLIQFQRPCFDMSFLPGKMTAVNTWLNIVFVMRPHSGSCWEREAEQKTKYENNIKRYRVGTPRSFLRSLDECLSRCYRTVHCDFQITCVSTTRTLSFRQKFAYPLCLANSGLKYT